MPSLPSRFSSIYAALFSGVGGPDGPEQSSAPLPDDQMPEDKELLGELLTRAQELYDAADSRRETIEAKANSMLGSTGLAVSLLMGAAALMLRQSDFLGKTQLIELGALLALTVSTFAYAAYKSLRVLRVAGWGHPNVRILITPSNSMVGLRRTWIAQLLRAREHNERLNSQKGGWLIEAHAWYLLGIASLVATGFLLLILLITSHSLAAKPLPNPLPVVILTPVNQATPAPTHTADTPTPTPTSSPVPTLPAVVTTTPMPIVR